MSEATDLSIILRGHQTKLSEHEVKLKAQNEAIAELQRKLAVLDRAQQTFENQIQIFRDGINEGFRKLRLELKNG